MKEEIIKLYNWLRMEDKPEKADLIFLFGGDAREIGHKGLELFNADLAPMIITTGDTGTFGPNWGKPCAEVFADQMLQNGIPKEKILIQNSSTNTPEDIIHALPILEKHDLNSKRIIIVSRPVHQRRAYATFLEQYPNEVVLINQPCNEKLPQEMNDVELRELGFRSIQEYERLIKYADKGDLKRQEIPDEITGVVESLKKRID